MAFKSKLSFNGKEFDVVYCDYQLKRKVDSKGRPNSEIQGGCEEGGLLKVTIEATEDTSITEAMANQYKPTTGTVIFNRGNEEAKMKEISWENGFITEIKEAFDLTKKDQDQVMLLSFTVSAQILKVGTAEFVQDLPTDR